MIILLMKVQMRSFIGIGAFDTEEEAEDFDTNDEDTSDNSGEETDETISPVAGEDEEDFEV